MTDQPAYTPTLPPDLPHDLRINTQDPRYKAAEKFACENKFTQQQFSALLAVEAHGVLAKRAAQPAQAAPAPAPVAPAKPYEKMTFAEKFQRRAS